MVSRKILAILLANLLCLSTSVAQDIDMGFGSKPKEEKSKPASGVLSQTSSGAGTGVAVETFGNEDPSGKSPQQLTGSVKQLRPGRWLATVRNNGGAVVTGSFRFIEVGNAGQDLKSTPFLQQIESKASYQREFPVGPNTHSARLSVEEWSEAKP